jgi:hypothetical protein
MLTSHVVKRSGESKAKFKNPEKSARKLSERCCASSRIKKSTAGVETIRPAYPCA